MRPFGLYVHVPYCRQACTYCDFYFSTSNKSRERWLTALMAEISLVANSWTAGDEITSIYFGGGTPSLLNASELAKILSAICNSWPVEPSSEITLEANPEDFTEGVAQTWREIGFNRLSIGVQSLSNEELLRMNRCHNARQSLQAIEMTLQAGFNSYSIDLIYATPWLTDESWTEALRRISIIRPPHISAYALTVEDKTRLAFDIKAGRTKSTSDEAFETQFLTLHALLAAAGYEGYEISNFAIPGHRARHNSSYWSGQPYLGLGPSAHSFDGASRWRNCPNVWKYVENLEMNHLPRVDIETLSLEDRINEYLMTRLRLAEGINWQELSDRFALSLQSDKNDLLAEFVGKGWLHLDVNGAKLSLKGRLLADRIASELFY